MLIQLADYGWTGVAPPKGGRLGRIVRVDRGECDVITSEGQLRVLSDSQRSQSEMAPVTGDWVLVGTDPNLTPLVKRVLPRSNTLSRRDPSNEVVEQVLVANVDLVLIVHGLDRPLPPGRLERYLVLAWDSGAEVAVILTKADREPKAAKETAAVVRAVAPGIDVMSVEVGGPCQDIAMVEALLRPGLTAALLGESGAGKSTLINALVGEEVLATGAVRSGDRKGRHTTVTREMVLCPAGGLLVDTPGLRSVGLWDAQEALDRVFGDLEELSTQCRFADCAHKMEPDCAVMADGRVAELRLARYLALRQELAEQSEREVERDRSERKRRR